MVWTAQGGPCGIGSQGEGKMTLLTSAECWEIAERKMVEAEGEPVHEGI
jgi:hypothetical protein